MKQMSWLFAAIIVFGLMWLVGCAKDSGPNDTQTDPKQLAAEAVIAIDSLFTSDIDYLDDGNPNDGTGLIAKIDTAILPINWGRKIDRSSFLRTVTTQVLNDSTVECTITHSWSGTLWVRGRLQGDTTRRTYLKPFTEQTMRKIRLVKFQNTTDEKRNWRLKEVSAMKGGTTSAPLISIDNVVFYVGTDTLNVSDPLNYFLQIGRPMNQHGVPVLPASFTQGFRVRVTITSPDSINHVTAHRPYWQNGWRFRAPMGNPISSVKNVDNSFTNVYEYSWRGVWSGRHHIVVSAVPKNVVFDNVAPASSTIWGIPFIVE
jgi:hypothetical protein